MIGQTVCHYRVLDRLGAGGMGEVYLAEDNTLGRRVALKFLSKDIAQTRAAEERLLREARAASLLNHPHICTVYEIGRHGERPFIAMECLEGDTLAGVLAGGRRSASATPTTGAGRALKIDDVLKFATEIADALAAAHAAGIVHRDIKPANVFITRRGDAKILDFGLAKLTAPGAASSGSSEMLTIAAEPSLTVPGTVAGTIAYMAPEQARGEPVDPRSDLFSLGVLLYELSTGCAPFAGPTAALTFDAILNRQPVPPMEINRDVPADFEGMVMRLLSKDPGARYQSAAHLLEELGALRRARARSDPGAGSGQAGPSIAVLPFANLSSDPENEYFSDGITEEIINALGHLGGLRVAARTSSFTFKGTAPDLADVGRKLRVGTVLTGSVRKASRRLRITVELVNVADGFQIWSERFDREADDIFAIQDEIATAVAGKLRVSLTVSGVERLGKRSTQNFEAYELYLKGRVLLNHRGAAIPRALEHFQRALALDPEYAPAHAGVADGYAVLAYYCALPASDAVPKARAAARRAVESDPSLADPHAALYYVAYAHEWDRSRAAAELSRALSLNPNLATALNWKSLFLAIEGRITEAVAVAQRVADLDPLAALPLTVLGTAHMCGRQFVEAEEVLRRAIDLDPMLWSAHHLLGAVQMLRGRHAEAIAALECALGMSNRHPWTMVIIAEAYRLEGRPDLADRLHDELVDRSRTAYVTAAWLGNSYAVAGRLDEAFAEYDRAVAEREFVPFLRGILPLTTLLRPVSQDPRFEALMQRVGVSLE